MSKIKGFTLIEVLVVIGIIATIIAVILPNLAGARGRARDARRKAELREMKNALRMYYNDYQTYPEGTKFPVKGCGADHISDCPCTAGGVTLDFAAGGTTGCDTIYMKRFPQDFTNDANSRVRYYATAGSDDFCLAAELENPGDDDITVSKARCSVACGGVGGNCDKATDYCVCAD